MGVLELIQQKAFLGKEFLTWLWFRSETGGAMDLRGGRTAEVEMMGPIVLDAQYGDARMTTLKGESPATAPEARAAFEECLRGEEAVYVGRVTEDAEVAVTHGAAPVVRAGVAQLAEAYRRTFEGF